MTHDKLSMHYHHHTTLDMTAGSISKLLLTFALPLIAGNLFQQLYNTVDSIVVGNYVGKEALAAIGSTTSLINTIIGFFGGLAAGGSVVIAQYFGAQEIVKLRKTVHTLVTGTIILGVVFTFVGIGAAPLMLRAMSTPDDVFANADAYLRIYFAGIISLMCYNIGSGILRAVGDSRRPLYFLIISSLLNVALDLLFVVVFQLGVAGVAYATIISETVSAILVFVVLARSNECYALAANELVISFDILKQIIKIGFPSGFQMAITAFSNVFVQGYINHFGSSFMAGWASYTKIDQFAFLPLQSVALAATTFVGQNYGARKIQRVKDGVHHALLLSFEITVVVIIPLMIFARELVSLFNKDAEVLYYGMFLIRACSPFYLAAAINHVYASALRGLGNSFPPMILMLCSFVVFRQLYLFIATRITDSFYPVAVAYPVGWVLCSILIVVYYHMYMQKLKFKVD